MHFDRRSPRSIHRLRRCNRHRRKGLRNRKERGRSRTWLRQRSSSRLYRRPVRRSPPGFRRNKYFPRRSPSLACTRRSSRSSRRDDEPRSRTRAVAGYSPRPSCTSSGCIDSGPWSLGRAGTPSRKHGVPPTSSRTPRNRYLQSRFVARSTRGTGSDFRSRGSCSRPLHRLRRLRRRPSLHRRSRRRRLGSLRHCFVRRHLPSRQRSWSSRRLRRSRRLPRCRPGHSRLPRYRRRSQIGLRSSSSYRRPLPSVPRPHCRCVRRIRQTSSPPCR